MCILDASLIVLRFGCFEYILIEALATNLCLLGGILYLLLSLSAPISFRGAEGETIA